MEAVRVLRLISVIVGSYLIKCAKSSRNHIYPLKVKFLSRWVAFQFQKLGLGLVFLLCLTINACLTLTSTKVSGTAFVSAHVRPEASQGFVLGQLSWGGVRTRAKLLENTLMNLPKRNWAVWDATGFCGFEWQCSLKSLILKAFLSNCLRASAFIWSFPQCMCWFKGSQLEVAPQSWTQHQYKSPEVLWTTNNSLWVLLGLGLQALHSFLCCFLCGKDAI